MYALIFCCILLCKSLHIIFIIFLPTQYYFQQVEFPIHLLCRQECNKYYLQWCVCVKYIGNEAETFIDMYWFLTQFAEAILPCCLDKCVTRFHLNVVGPQQSNASNRVQCNMWRTRHVTQMWVNTETDILNYISGALHFTFPTEYKRRHDVWISRVLSLCLSRTEPALTEAAELQLNDAAVMAHN
jgi:hypothetical protein